MRSERQIIAGSGPTGNGRYVFGLGLLSVGDVIGEKDNLGNLARLATNGRTCERDVSIVPFCASPDSYGQSTPLKPLGDESDPTSVVAVIGRLVFFRYNRGFPE